VLAGVVASWVWVGIAPAQSPPRPAAPGSLAAYAPSDCGLFLQIERPEDINPSLRDVNAWSLLQLLLGGELEPPDNAADWYDVLVANLAGESASAMRELFSERAALVAPTWTRLSDGVLLIQVPGPAALRPLIGPGLVESERQEDGLSIYTSTRGLLIATDGRTVVIAQRQAPSRWFSCCLDLLRGKSKDSLSSVPEFAAKLKELPRLVPQGFLYFATEVPAATTAPATTSAPVAESGPATETAPAATTAPVVEAAPVLEGVVPWPALRAGAVGMYVRGNRVDFLLRAALGRPPAGPAPPVDLTWFKHLPRSTLVVWATALDVDAAFDRLVSASPDSTAWSYTAFFTDVLNPEQLKRDVVSKIGPRLMLVWGHDFLAEEGGSSLGVLVESTDADAVKQALDVAVREVAAVVNAARSADDETPLRVTTQDISGAEVTVIELADYLAEKPVSGVALRLASTMRLCYTALDNWVVVAWRVEHMRELIAAHLGTQPVLGEFPDVAALRPLRRGPTVLAVGPLATAAAVMGDWLDRAERQPDSIVNLYARGPADEPGGRGRVLGLGLGPQTRPGCVPVAQVYEDGPCYGLVEDGDDIVALNGRILALQEAHADLRRQLDQAAGERIVLLRIERAGLFHDVEVPLDPPPNPRIAVVADAVRALRRLQTLSRHLAFATLAVNQNEADSYQAHFRLRFSERVGESAGPAATSRPSSN
jgi:hypothetical protein